MQWTIKIKRSCTLLCYFPHVLWQLYIQFFLRPTLDTLLSHVYSLQTLGTHSSQNTFPSDFYMASFFIFFSLPFQWCLFYSAFHITMLPAHLHLSLSDPSFPIPLPCFMFLCSTHHYVTWPEVDAGHWDL